MKAVPSDSAKAHSFARCGASTQLARASCCVCRRAFSNGSACYVDQTKVKLKRFHLWCKQRPAALDGVEAQTVPGFASLSATAKEAVRELGSRRRRNNGCAPRSQNARGRWRLLVFILRPPMIQWMDLVRRCARSPPQPHLLYLHPMRRRRTIMGMAHLPGSHLLGNGSASVTTTWTPRRAATASGRRLGRTQHGAA
jgi:hypothetical protein